MIEFNLLAYDYIDLNNFTFPEIITVKAERKLRAKRIFIPTKVDIQPPIVNDDTVYCLRCGRKLKDCKSKNIGMGQMCYKHIQKSRNKQIDLFAMQIKSNE